VQLNYYHNIKPLVKTVAGGRPPETPNAHTNQILAAIDPLDHIVEGAEEIAAVRGQSVKRTRYLLEHNQIDADKVGRKWITNVRRALRPRKSGSARWAMSPSFGRSRLCDSIARNVVRRRTAHAVAGGTIL
jgi:hypothetical protein